MNGYTCPSCGLDDDGAEVEMQYHRGYLICDACGYSERSVDRHEELVSICY